VAGQDRSKYGWLFSLKGLSPFSLPFSVIGRGKEGEGGGDGNATSANGPSCSVGRARILSALYTCCGRMTGGGGRGGRSTSAVPML